MKLFPLFFEKADTKQFNGTQLWSWRKASLLVIDDINPGDPIKNELVTPDFFLSILDTFSGSNIDNRITLKNKNVIWVLGDKSIDPELFEKWKSMLVKIDVEEKNISVINLL